MFEYVHDSEIVNVLKMKQKYATVPKLKYKTEDIGKSEKILVN